MRHFFAFFRVFGGQALPNFVRRLHPGHVQPQRTHFHKIDDFKVGFKAKYRQSLCCIGRYWIFSWGTFCRVLLDLYCYKRYEFVEFLIFREINSNFSWENRIWLAFWLCVLLEHVSGPRGYITFLILPHEKIKTSWGISFSERIACKFRNSRKHHKEYG